MGPTDHHDNEAALHHYHDHGGDHINDIHHIPAGNIHVRHKYDSTKRVLIIDIDSAVIDLRDIDFAFNGRPYYFRSPDNDPTGNSDDTTDDGNANLLNIVAAVNQWTSDHDNGRTVDNLRVDFIDKLAAIYAADDEHATKHALRAVLAAAKQLADHRQRH